MGDYVYILTLFSICVKHIFVLILQIVNNSGPSATRLAGSRCIVMYAYKS